MPDPNASTTERKHSPYTLTLLHGDDGATLHVRDATGQTVAIIGLDWFDRDRPIALVWDQAHVDSEPSTKVHLLTGASVPL